MHILTPTEYHAGGPGADLRPHRDHALPHGVPCMNISCMAALMQVALEQVSSLDEVQRFYMVMEPSARKGATPGRQAGFRPGSPPPTSHPPNFSTLCRLLRRPAPCTLHVSLHQRPYSPCTPLRADPWGGLCPCCAHAQAPSCPRA